MVRVHVRVTGLVQGVSYRASLAAEARRLALVGWVRNVADGSVELEAEGERAVVDALIAWARRGPPSARVTELSVVDRTPTGGDRDFSIRA